MVSGFYQILIIQYNAKKISNLLFGEIEISFHTRLNSLN